MAPSSEARINSYVKEFFPSGDLVKVAILDTYNGVAPLVVIDLESPITGENAICSAYLHEVLDISFMSQLASSLIQSKTVQADLYFQMRPT